ncbi:hypothetical protein A2765_02855 [Candidatus Kaiserbacteria bacterium RIFCSPHIGHO2_01_FULL_56_24]|uniref:Uncharacterized protein n=1 Tax=Candidatus Kaiserbacteria bacterium RIFCSPHIGHO2_01_FULL_56_24 TaxID=1798487 RepID=A0A1F6DB17_9BACT|nr:MAG: hypothetical protein A2765_02855 [Candidatus Kaiserbacteria bacterium RIFCSPHIGHO2_01_FULL_56_24]
MSTQAEVRMRVEDEIRHRWRGFPMLTGFILAALDWSLQGFIEPLAWLDGKLKRQVQHICSRYGLQFPG